MTTSQSHTIRRIRHAHRGFTLLEILLAMSLSVIIMSAVALEMKNESAARTMTSFFMSERLLRWIRDSHAPSFNMSRMRHERRSGRHLTDRRPI